MFSAQNAKKKWDCLEYLSKKNVRDVLESLAAELVLHKPNSPLDYLLARVEQLSKGPHAPQKPNVVLMMGTPYSGKGTQCAMLVEKFGAVHLHGGDLLQKELRSGSDKGKLIEKQQKAKKPIPTEVYISLVQAEIELHSSSSPSPGPVVFVLDDFPTTVAQALALEKLVCEVRFVLFVECTEAQAQRRRAQKQHEENHGITEQMLHDRFKEFQAHVLPVVEYFAAVGKLRRVVGSGSVADVAKQAELAFMPSLLL